MTLLSIGRVMSRKLSKSLYTNEQKILQTLLRTHRQQAGLTQAELADLLGIPPSRISDYERGGRRMDLPQLRTYVEAMNVPLTTFVEQWVELCREPGTVK